MNTPTRQATDEQLMARVQGGDASAYELLVVRHRSAVASVARGACGPDLADDVAQVALLAAWQHSATYKPDRGTPRAWLLGIVRNRGIDQIRSVTARQRHAVTVDPQGWASVTENAPAPDEPVDILLDRRETERAVRRLLVEIPLDQRHVIELAYFWGLSHSEIAERLDIPVGTVKGRLRLGLSKLRRSWADVATAPDRAAA